MEKALNDYKISVIIPVFNTQRYLQECMDSVLAQSFEGMEILCVDDGSTDDSSIILDRYREQDERIRVFHIANGGYGHAVNYGIDRAKGTYISIVEPDDYIEGAMLEILYQQAEEKELDMITSNYKRFRGTGSERFFWIDQVMKEDEYYDKVLNPYTERELFKGTFLNQAGLFRLDFINKYHIRHHESPGAAYQDVGFRLQTLAYSRRFMIVRDSFYCHREDNPDSSIHNRTKINWIINEYAYVFKMMELDKDLLGVFLPEFTRCKITDYLEQYDRLVPELKLDFLEIIRKELMEYDQKGKFITTQLTDRQLKRVTFILNDPVSYANRESLLRNEIHTRMAGVNEFVIYGAGMFGRKIYQIMENSDRNKLLGFAVSDVSSNLREYEGKPVKDIKDYDQSLPVIVGVTEKFEQEVVSLLRNKGIENIVCMESRQWF